ncbi:MAG: hypothetical protein ACK5L0_09285 [Candidatus Fimivivens sp.]
MRRIYKPANVTTSETCFLLGDTGEQTSAEGGDDGDGLDDPEERKNATHTHMNQNDNSNELANKHRHTVQDMARLEQLRDQIIAQATAESARLIEKGHAKAQTEYQAALARASAQIERDRQAACMEGQQQALHQTKEDITTCIRNIEQTLIHLESTQARFITGYEQDLKWMSLEIAQKILMDKISADDTQLVPLVMNAVNSVSDTPWMSVEISEHMTGLLTQLQQKLQSAPAGSKVNIRLNDAPPDTCIIETPDKFFDASIRQQIENLKGYFAAEQVTHHE